MSKKAKVVGSDIKQTPPGRISPSNAPLSSCVNRLGKSDQLSFSTQDKANGVSSRWEHVWQGSLILLTPVLKCERNSQGVNGT